LTCSAARIERPATADMPHFSREAGDKELFP
jgi:hypothetical protein